MRIRLDIAYDGTHFRGWARQPGLRTVQGTLEDALARILGGDPRSWSPGAPMPASTPPGRWRTSTSTRRSRSGSPRDGRVAADASAAETRRRGARRAHARASSARTPTSIVPPRGARPGGLRRALLGGVAPLRATASPTATSGYDPLERHRTTTVRAALDESEMDAAARSLIGLHDFAAYCKPREEATTIRTLLEFDWRRDADGVLVANVKADAFCHSMVRALVGACVAVGEGRLDADDIVDIRDARERVPEVKVLAARGLTLTEVGYPADDLLAGARRADPRAPRPRRGVTPAAVASA